MTIKPKMTNNVKTRKFQTGGEMEMADQAAMEGAEMGGAAAADAEAGGGDPIMQIAQMAMQALQAQDCNLAMQTCQMFVQLVQQAQGGGASAGPAPEGEPVYRRGGKLAYRIKK